MTANYARRAILSVLNIFLALAQNVGKTWKRNNIFESGAGRTQRRFLPKARPRLVYALDPVVKSLHRLVLRRVRAIVRNLPPGFLKTGLLGSFGTIVHLNVHHRKDRVSIRTKVGKFILLVHPFGLFGLGL
ncbi:hypothetical protein MRX96_051342 [Rhipicephalus microplus]